MILTDSPTLDLLIKFSSALAALFAAFVTGWFARRNEYQKWLLTNRSEVFGQFIAFLGERMDEADRILAVERSSWMRKTLGTAKEADRTSGREPWEGSDSERRIFDIFIQIERKSKVVGFYLPKNVRKTFADLILDLKDPYLDMVNAPLDREEFFKIYSDFGERVLRTVTEIEAHLEYAIDQLTFSFERTLQRPSFAPSQKTTSKETIPAQV